MRRTIATLALALSLASCYSAAQPGVSQAPTGGTAAEESADDEGTAESPPITDPIDGPVELLTARLGCYAGGEGGPTALLVADPKYGTSFSGRPVIWPAGYTARRVGTEVIVLDGDGKVKATTGRTYHISQAMVIDAGYGPYKDDALPAAVECGYHHDFIDCTANPTDMWCQPRELPSYTPTEHPPGWQPG